jgi:hypothetical protein
MVRQYRSVGWPVVDATIQKGPAGFVPIGGGEGTPACFVGYVFPATAQHTRAYLLCTEMGMK